jgi:hypothetical protein
MDSFYKGFAELNETETDQRSELAGVKRLERFGSFGTWVELARRGALGSTIDEVLKQPTRVVYNLMLYDKLKAEYERNLMKQK